MIVLCAVTKTVIGIFFVKSNVPINVLTTPLAVVYFMLAVALCIAANYMMTTRTLCRTIISRNIIQSHALLNGSTDLTKLSTKMWEKNLHRIDNFYISHI